MAVTTIKRSLTDSELLENIVQGDNISFELLFHRHYSRVYGLVFRIVGQPAEAEDIVQDVFIQLYRRPPARQQETQHVGAWLYRVATNTAYNAIRGRQRLWQRNTHLVQDEKDHQAGPERSAEVEEERQKVRQALVKLKPMQAQLLIMRQMGLSYADLAEACQIPATSVGKQLSRAAHSFRKAYEALK